ncbi:hypothetical protein [Chryseobacterium lineare]
MIIRVLRISASLFLLFLGGLIYLIFRTERLIMFRWVEYLKLSDVITNLQKISTLYILPDWFKYSLPDGLWIYSYTAILLEIWKQTVTKQNVFWILSIPSTAVLSEFFQLLKILPGTFDLIDLIFYFVGILIPLCYATIIHFNNKKYENY